LGFGVVDGTRTGLAGRTRQDATHPFRNAARRVLGRCALERDRTRQGATHPEGKSVNMATVVSVCE
ncbi:MAG: hypothetical protein SFV81_06290, partial [Pirellulaceae bacterium]|nr:hypothetical protein [Pirellulaceae bacterium]